MEILLYTVCLSLNSSSKVGNSDTILIYASLLMNKTTQSGKFSQSLNNTLTNGVFIIWTELNPDFDT